MARMINPDHTKALVALLNKSPYFQLLSMKMLDIQYGHALLEVDDIENKHFNPLGGVHGGLYASIVDTVAFWAVYYDLDEGVGITTLDLSVDYVSPAISGKLMARGKRIRTGKTICFASAEINDEKGRLIAQGSSKMVVLPGQPVSNLIVSFLGTNPLPPKFLV